MEGWESIPLAACCAVFTDGDWIEKKDQSPCGIRLIQTGNIGEGTFKDRSSKARYVSEDTYRRLKCTEIFAGDCLVSRLPDPVGRSCIIPEVDERMITAVDCSILRLDSGKVLPDYFRYYSQSRPYLDSVDAHCTGATRRRISRKNLGKVPIPLPLLPEQERIVAILDEAFAAIETATTNTEKNLANARELFESQLKLAFTVDARMEGWTQCTIEDAFHVDYGTRITRKKDAGTLFPVYGGGGETFRADTHNRENCVVIARFGISERCTRFVPGKFFLNDSGLTLRPRKDGLLDENFLRYLVLAQNEAIYELGRGTAQKNLDVPALRNLRIRFPSSLPEQERIVAALDDASASTSALIRINEQKLSRLTDLKQSLLQQAFTGRLTADPKTADRLLSETSV